MKTEILSTQNLEATLDRVCLELSKGEVVAIPTETVYGLGSNALNEDAILKIFHSKSRPLFDPLIVHVSKSIDIESMIDKGWIAGDLAPAVRKLYDCLTKTFWPGPLTLVMPRGKNIPDLISSGLNTVAIRMPRHDFFQALLGKCEFPIAAPSANRFGSISPVSAKDVEKELGGIIRTIVDDGASDRSVGVESTILHLCPDGHTGKVALLRPGGTSIEAIDEVLSKNFGPDIWIEKNQIHFGTLGNDSREQSNQSVTNSKAFPESEELLAPGMLKSHYAPRKPLFLFESLQAFQQLPWTKSKYWGVLFLTDQEKEHYIEALDQKKSVVVGSSLTDISINDEGAARNLFKRLRDLDESNADLLAAQLPRNNKGLWFAIRDRLSRAGHSTSIYLCLFIFTALLQPIESMADVQGETKFSRQVENSFAITKRKSLHIANSRGSIYVYPSNNDRLRVVSHQTVRAESEVDAKKLFEGISLKLIDQANELYLNAEYTKDKDLTARFRERMDPKSSMSIDVYVPPRLFVKVFGNKDEVKVERMRGSLEVRTTSGPIHLKDNQLHTLLVNCLSCNQHLQVTEARDSKITSLSGTINIANAKLEKGYIEANENSVSMLDIEGDLNIFTRSGSILGKNIRGSVYFVSSSGRVELNDVQGLASGETMSGTIRISYKTLSIPEKMFIESREGNIDLFLPLNVNAEIDLWSARGTTLSSLVLKQNTHDRLSKLRPFGPDPYNRLRGETGLGGPLIQVISQTGNVALMKNGED